MGAPIHGNIEATKTASTTKGSPSLGDIMHVGNKQFEYCLAGAAAIGAGKLCMSKAAPTRHDMDVVVAAAAVDAKSLSLTIIATDSQNITKNQFAEIGLNDGGGEGHLYEIAYHSAVDVSETTTLVVNLKEKIREATVASTTLGMLTAHRADGVLLYNVDLVTGGVVGVAPTEISANEYFWAQKKGRAVVLMSAGGSGEVVATVGDTVRASSSNGVDGSVTRQGSTTINVDKQPYIGTYAGIAVVDTDYGFVDLNIA